MMSRDTENVDSKTPPRRQSSEESPQHNGGISTSGVYESSGDELEDPVLKFKKRAQRFLDSDSDEPRANKPVDDHTLDCNSEQNNDQEVSSIMFKKGSNKSRIRKISGSSNSDSECDSVLDAAAKNDEQQLRMVKKKNKLKDKFKNLLSSRGRDKQSAKENVEKRSSRDNSDKEDSESSNDEESSIDIIKQKIKERSALLKMSICDPDESDEESTHMPAKSIYKPKKVQKRTKLTSPKPQRMSAKQAMENMQKIKSESNRMLREREVSLPYHRPKALSLQDIMSRRRPAVSSDGKALPIKMNQEQLQQYVLLLEERQKDMMELCRSESEEDEPSKGDEPLQVENAIEDTPIVNNPVDAEPIKEMSLDDITNPGTVDITSANIAKIVSTDDIIDREQDDEGNLEASPGMNEINRGEAVNDIATNSVDESRLLEDLRIRTKDTSAEMELVYNDSIEEENQTKLSEINKEENHTGREEEEQVNQPLNGNQNGTIQSTEGINNPKNSVENDATNETEQESQLISLHYDSEKTEPFEVNTLILEDNKVQEDPSSDKSDNNSEIKTFAAAEIEFLDDDMDMDEINMDDIDSIIENAEILKDSDSGVMNSPALIKEIPVLNVKPKLTGAPGMVIDLDGNNPIGPKKLTGVELLKERFTYFSKLKTPEEMEREREKRQKPGAQHWKLKQELEDKIAEQRSFEWHNRLESEKQHQTELDAVRGDDASDADDDIDKIEAKLKDDDIEKDSSSETEEEELLEDDVLIEDKPKRKNKLIADEAEESDIEENEENSKETVDVNNEVDDGIDGDNEKDESENESSSEEESSESEDEKETKPKKGRILKAFEDSDDEDVSSLKLGNEKIAATENKEATDVTRSDIIASDEPSQIHSDGITDSQDDVIQLAQVPKQISADAFTSQGSTVKISQTTHVTSDSKDDEDLGTQTFSILDSNRTVTDIINSQLDDPDKLISDDLDKLPDGFTVISESQPYSDNNLDAVVEMCSGNFQTQNCIPIQPPSSQSDMSQSQAIGDDLLNMCTGQFYDNQFVAENENTANLNTSEDMSQDPSPTDPKSECVVNEKHFEINTSATAIKAQEKQKQEEDILKSVLDELNEPDIDNTKPLKFFFDGKSQNKENQRNVTNTQVKKRFVIDSDDETNENADLTVLKKKKKLKKRKLEDRALQISDDEDDLSEHEEEDDYMSDIDDNKDESEEKLVEYDSEENEVEVIPQKIKKQKRKANEFFEQEAELTSEDEWLGSGDEDERGLDRMEREEGDDETFHQGRLQRELGQIHMRDVLDQDKREVRLIQELLFEDGDLGGGGRQRKFRWRNAAGEEVSGTIPEVLKDTQEEEFESEEQWRKQRHEREMFLRQMKNEDKEDDLNVSVNRSTIIKANLASRTMSSLLEEVNQTKTEVTKITPPVEKKTAQDIPSPMKTGFPMFQQNYHGSLLSRGQGALARLAALATPLAAADDAPAGQLARTSKGNFVFAALTQGDPEAKVTKRKADTNIGTPRLVKKMKTEEKRLSKSSLLDHLKT